MIEQCSVIIVVCMLLLVLSVIHTFNDIRITLTEKKRKHIDKFLDKKTNEIGYDQGFQLLSDSTFDLRCCPSSYSTDRGCLCEDPKNKRLFETRGGNSSKSTCCA